MDASEVPHPPAPREPWRYGQKLALTVAILSALWLWHSAMQVWLLVFAAILLGIVLNRASCSISTRTPLSRKWALLLVSFTLLTLIVLSVWLMAPAVGTQFQELQRSLPRSIERLRQHLSEYAWGEQALKAADQSQAFLPEGSELVKRVAGLFSSTLGAVSALALIVFLGFCFAIEPRLYTEGVIHLLPIQHRPRGREILSKLEVTLAHWILARATAMTLVAVLAGISLWALGMPLAFILALLIGIFDFIPNIGPFIAVIPALLLALLISPIKELHVAIALFSIQMLEGYLITPTLERKAVELPPALTATAQVLLGLSAGILGIALAAPLTAAAIVLVKELYVRDYLGDRSVGVAQPQVEHSREQA